MNRRRRMGRAGGRTTRANSLTDPKDKVVIAPDDGHTQPMSRRDFLALSLVGALAGCLPLSAVQPLTSEPTSTWTPESEPTEEPSPTANLDPVNETPTAAPTETSVAVPEPSPMPVAIPVLGRVVSITDSNVWRGTTLAPDRLQQMLDSGLTGLMGIAQADRAWATLFSPEDRVAIKVNTIAGSAYWTHVSLVTALAERLQSVGVPAEQIVVYDRQSNEMASAGYSVNRDGPDVRCYGTDGDYADGWTLLGTGIGLSQILLDCNALINVPLLKSHSISGMSFALKNHYGTLDRPGKFHGPRMTEALADLNGLPPIAERTRLTVGDALEICTKGWSSAAIGNSILMSRDPVAHDAVGLQMLASAIEREGGNPTAARKRAAPWLAYAAEAGLGVADPELIELLELVLG